MLSARVRGLTGSGDVPSDVLSSGLHWQYRREKWISTRSRSCVSPIRGNAFKNVLQIEKDISTYRSRWKSTAQGPTGAMWGAKGQQPFSKSMEQMWSRSVDSSTAPTAWVLLCDFPRRAASSHPAPHTLACSHAHPACWAPCQLSCLNPALSLAKENGASWGCTAGAGFTSW